MPIFYQRVMLVFSNKFYYLPLSGVELSINADPSCIIVIVDFLIQKLNFESD